MLFLLMAPFLFPSNIITANFIKSKFSIDYSSATNSLLLKEFRTDLPVTCH